MMGQTPVHRVQIIDKWMAKINKNETIYPIGLPARREDSIKISSKKNRSSAWAEDKYASQTLSQISTIRFL